MRDIMAKDSYHPSRSEEYASSPLNPIQKPGASSFAMFRKVGQKTPCVQSSTSYAPSIAYLQWAGGAMLALLFFTSTILFAEADGKWLHRVPNEDHARTNPVANEPQAAAAGKVLFGENCAKCHGTEANGLHNRPSLRSERIRQATDGDLSWILKNGNPYKGMPPWSSLPEQQRWQIIAYIRTLPPAPAR